MIFAGHVAATFELYAAGDSSGLLFLVLPFVAAVAGYFFVARASGIFGHGSVACGGAALILACLSCCAGMTWAFNTFGT